MIFPSKFFPLSADVGVKVVDCPVPITVVKRASSICEICPLFYTLKNSLKL